MTHPFVGIGHLPEKQFLPPVARPETKAPANSNNDYDENEAAYNAGKAEYIWEQATRELFAMKGPERAEKHMKQFIKDLGWR